MNEKRDFEVGDRVKGNVTGREATVFLDGAVFKAKFDNGDTPIHVNSGGFTLIEPADTVTLELTRDEIGRINDIFMIVAYEDDLDRSIQTKTCRSTPSLKPDLPKMLGDHKIEYTAEGLKVGGQLIPVGTLQFVLGNGGSSSWEDGWVVGRSSNTLVCDIVLRGEGSIHPHCDQLAAMIDKCKKKGDA